MPDGDGSYASARRTGGSADLRHGNLTQILRYVRDHGASSRHSIAHGCGLGISTMTDLIGELRDRRLVRELDPVRRLGAGRPTRPIALDGEPWCVLGVRIEIDQIQFAAATVGGRVLWQETVPVELFHAGADAGFAIVDAALRTQLDQFTPEQHLVAVEIGVPGYVGRDGGTVSWAADLDWSDLPLAAMVEASLSELGRAGVHTRISNQSQLAALNAARIELRLPAEEVAVYLGGSRAIGGAVIVDSEIFRGANGGGGDFGHLNVDPTGPPEECGRSGCLSAYASPYVLLTSSGLMTAEDAELALREQPHKAIRQIVEAAELGDATVLETIEVAGRALGRVIDDLIGTLNPHTVVLGGYLGQLSPYLLGQVNAQIASRAGLAAFAATTVRALDQPVARALAGAVLAARDACLYNPLTLTRHLA